MYGEYRVYEMGTNLVSMEEMEKLSQIVQKAFMRNKIPNEHYLFPSTYF